MIFDECMDGLAEDGGTADAGNLARETERARDFRRGDFNAQCALRLNVGELAERIGRAVGNELAVINVGYVAAALGFVHVVGGDEEGDAMTGKLEKEIPELAARHRVDAGGGLVEEKKGRLVQHGAAQSEALLPATGKLRGQTSQIGCQAVELNNFFDAALQARGLQAVDAAVKLQVFRHGQIVVEAEVLRHVADVLADGFRICADVQAFDKGGAAAEWQKTCEHFDDGGFSAAVGAEETKDFALFDTEAYVVDGREIAEAPNQMFGGDSGFGWIFRHRVKFPLSASRRQPCRQGPGRRDH